MVSFSLPAESFSSRFQQTSPQNCYKLTVFTLAAEYLAANPVSECPKVCKASGKLFVFVGRSLNSPSKFNCHCTNSYDSENLTDGENCRLKCPGKPAAACGGEADTGYYSMFSTGFAAPPPPAPMPLPDPAPQTATIPTMNEVTTTFLQDSQIPPTSVSIPQLPPVTRISHQSLETTKIQSIPVEAIIQHTSSSLIISTLHNDISATTMAVLLHSTTSISNADTSVPAPPPINLSKPEDPISAIKLEGIIGIAICTTVAFFAGLGACFYCWRTVRSRTDSNLGETFSAGFFSKVSRTRDFTSRRFAVLRDEQYPNVSVEIPYGNDYHITNHAIIEPSILKLTHQTSSDARISFQKGSRRENTINSLLKMNQERSGTTSAKSWFSARWNSRGSVVHEKLRVPLDISPTASPRFVGCNTMIKVGHDS